MAMHLANAISYITDGEKTQEGALVGSHNCNVDTALQEMISVKRKYGKLDKRQGYHFIISFKKQEVRPETAMEITQKFVERYFGDDFQCLYATHDNTQHVHSHILFNSVSWRTGKKYRYEKGDWAKEIQPIVNDLCKEYGLSIQDIEVGAEEKPLKKWDKTKQGIFKWNRQIRLDVEDSISFANSYENFLKLMELKGYEIKQKSGETYLKPMGEKRFILLTDISAYYTKESIESQIEKGVQHKSGRTGNCAPRIVRCRKNYKKYFPPTQYQNAFFAKMYRTGQLKRKPYSQMWRYKEEAVRFEKLQSQYLYLCRHNVRSADDLKIRRDILDTQIKNLDEERHQIYKWRYPYKPALALLKTIEENETRASYYKEGSIFYAPYYEKWKEAVEALAEKGYTVGQLMEMKETVQNQLASVAKSKKELKKEGNLIDSILYGESRTQVLGKKVPELEVMRTSDILEQNTKEANIPEKEMETENPRKGGGVEKEKFPEIENPETKNKAVKTDTAHMDKQPAQNEKQEQPEQAR